MEKDFFDLKNDEELKEWLAEVKSLAAIATKHPEIPTLYRNRLDEWQSFETSQREELSEFYEERLMETSRDSAQYCNFQISVDELRNLCDSDLYGFEAYVGVMVPYAEIERRLQEANLDTEPTLKVIKELTEDILTKESIRRSFENL